MNPTATPSMRNGLQRARLELAARNELHWATTSSKLFSGAAMIHTEQGSQGRGTGQGRIEAPGRAGSSHGARSTGPGSTGRHRAQAAADGATRPATRPGSDPRRAGCDPGQAVDEAGSEAVDDAGS